MVAMSGTWVLLLQNRCPQQTTVSLFQLLTAGQVESDRSGFCARVCPQTSQLPQKGQGQESVAQLGSALGTGTVGTT